MARSIQTHREPGAWREYSHIAIRDGAERVEGVVQRTRIVPVDAGFAGDDRIELRLKLENEQETGSFKARGAWNQISQLTADERAAGVVCTSSGNHGKALAWAAHRGGVPATILMPKDAYPNKVQACRDEEAEVVLCETRLAAEQLCEELVASGKVLVHPYDAERTLQGAGTVGLEIAQDWPEVEVCVFPVGGGGLICGSSLALREELGEDLRIFGAEPAGAPSMTRGIVAGEPVFLDDITTQVQGLCPINSGALNVDVCSRAVDQVFVVEDQEVFDAQLELLRRGHRAEPAGSATSALLRAGLIPDDLLQGRSQENPLRVCAVLSGGNAAPDQIAALEAQL